MQYLRFFVISILILTAQIVFSQTLTQLGNDIDGTTGDGQGTSVSLSSDGLTMATGAASAPNSSLKGLVRVYTWNGSTWTQKGSDILGEADGDSFGAKVSLSDNGNIIAIAAPTKDLGVNMAPWGRVKIYEWNGSSWTQKGSDLDGEADFENFGQDICLSGNGTRLAIGIPGKDTNGATAGGETGAVRVYEYSTDWTQIGSDLVGDEELAVFGETVSLNQDGTTLAVGNSLHSAGGNFAGQVKVYRWNTSAWEAKGTSLSTFNGNTDDAMGAISLSNDGNRLAIGAPNSLFGAGPTYFGYVKVYDYASESWTQVGSNIGSNVDADNFGKEIELSGDGTHIIIGAANYVDPGNLNGRAQLWKLNVNTWEQVDVTLSGETEFDAFGTDVSINSDGSYVAIASPINSGGGSDAGHVRIFQQTAPDITDPTLIITSTENSPTSANPIPISITFSEEVTGFTVGDITVGNGTAGDLLSADNIVFTANITPTSDGTVTVDVNASVAQDLASNNNEAATQFSITYTFADVTAPTVAITSTENSPTNANPIPITITFSEEVTGFVVGDITVGNGTVGNLQSADNIVYTAIINPTASGAVTVDIAAGVAQDLASNNNDAAIQFSIIYNLDPIANFSFSINAFSVDFSDISTDDGTIVAWQWDFGDGNTSTQQNPSHTYATYGTYTIILAVTDDIGATNSTNQSITITPQKYSGGLGTIDSPYLIENTDDLKELSETTSDWEMFFKQIANITFISTDFETGGDFYNNGEGFSPIGRENITAFKGSYDGGNFTIDGLMINLPISISVGMFGYTSETATIKNLGLTNVSIVGTNNVGGLVGKNWGSIENCYTTGTVTGNDNVGGLIGYLTYGFVSNCYTAGSVNGTSYVGGGVGDFIGGSITNTYSSASVSGSSQVGGLIGVNTLGGPINNSFWDINSSGQHTSNGGTGKTHEEMKTKATFTDAGWDFVGETANGMNDIWKMDIDGCGYPIFSWQDPFTNCRTLKYSGGEGNVDSPYLIANTDDLKELSETTSDWEMHFKQIADIAFISTDFETGGDFYNNGEGFSPIGNSSTIPFTGSYYSNSFTIDGLMINLPAGTAVGMFGYTSETATIKNLGLTNVSIVGKSDVGALVGYNLGSIENCYTTGTVTGNDDVGGLVGQMNDGSISTSYSSVSVEGVEYVGAFLGYLVNGTANNCYSAGSVTGTYRVGGLIGYHFGTVNNSYSSATVTGTTLVGGLIGSNIGGGPLNNSFWDIRSSGQSTSDGGTGKTHEEMKTKATFTNSGWDFVGETANGINDIWKMDIDGCGYPIFSWQDPFINCRNLSTVENLENDIITSKVLPNPARDFVNVQLPKEEKNACYQIIDLKGQVVQKGNFNTTQNSLNLINLKSESYILIIITDQNVYTNKLIKL